MRKTNRALSDLVCLNCGNVITIPRKQGREKYHIKDMYCNNCMKPTQFIEMKDVSIFKKEIEFANYVSEKDQYIYDLICNNENQKNDILKR